MLKSLHPTAQLSLLSCLQSASLSSSVFLSVFFIPSLRLLQSFSPSSSVFLSIFFSLPLCHLQSSSPSSSIFLSVFFSLPLRLLQSSSQSSSPSSSVFLSIFFSLPLCLPQSASPSSCLEFLRQHKVSCTNMEKDTHTYVQRRRREIQRRMDTLTAIENTYLQDIVTIISTEL